MSVANVLLTLMIAVLPSALNFAPLSAGQLLPQNAERIDPWHQQTGAQFSGDATVANPRQRGDAGRIRPFSFASILICDPFTKSQSDVPVLFSVPPEPLFSVVGKEEQDTQIQPIGFQTTTTGPAERSPGSPFIYRLQDMSKPGDERAVRDGEREIDHSGLGDTRAASDSSSAESVSESSPPGGESPQADETRRQAAGNFMVLQTPAVIENPRAEQSVRAETAARPLTRPTLSPLQAIQQNQNAVQQTTTSQRPLQQLASRQQAELPQDGSGQDNAAVPVPPTAENAAETDVATPLTLDVVSTRRGAAEQRTDLSEELKTQVLKHFQRATELLTTKAETDKRLAELRAERDNGPALIADLKAQLNQPPAKADPELPADATVTELDQLRLADEDKAAEARRNQETWEAKAKIRTERKPQMPALIETTRKQVEDAEKAMAAAVPEGENPVLGIARHTEQEALTLLLKSQLELYRVEQMRYEALNELFPLQRDMLLRNRNILDKRVELWKTILADARREESARQAQEAREKLRNAHPTLRDLAEHNSSLTVRRKELQECMSTWGAQLSAVNTSLEGIENKFRKVTEKESRAGLTTAIGLLLRSQRNHLPDASEYHRRQQQVEQDIVRLQTEQMQLEDERNDLSDIETHIATTLGPIDSEDISSEELNQMAHELLIDRRKYLDDLLADYDAGLLALGETDVACRRLQSMIYEYESYIDERVLWIRSAAAVDLSFPERTLKAVNAFATHRQWVPLLGFMMADVKTYWLLYLVALLFVGGLVTSQPRARKMVSELGAVAERQTGSGIPQTLLATGLTIVMAAAVPVVLWFVGWRMSHSDLNLASALSDALKFGASALWLVNSFRGMCRRRGVAEAFLEWPEAIVRSLYSSLLLYIAGGVPLCFVVVTAGKLDEGTSADSVGRLAFVCFCVLLAAMLRRIVRPNGAVIGNLLRSNPNSLMYRLRWVWYPMTVGSPLSLAVLALMGYQYTAEQLMMRLQLTLGLCIVLLMTYTMLMQWMLAARKSLAIKHARQRRAAALAAAQREADEQGTASSPIPPVEAPQVDLSLLNQQMLRLARGTACILFLSASWAIWGQVLPALQVFSRIELWQIVVDTTEKIDAASDASAIREISRVEPVTLGHLLLSLGVMAVAVLSSRNLPGLLELVVLQRLPMDHGGRNAITTLCRYAFMLTGIIIASNTIGVSWGSVQWLVAALTVGLGFGLQEIFANFVSGLIILFERPIRIGDVVTIDGVSGAVSRIQIRATTITDWDRKEYIVPNKEFVTGKLLNWTLSDKTNRVVINVGVAYGTDIEHALNLLEEIALKHSLVLEDPAPVVGFEGFGDSTLNLVLRCYLPNLDHRLKVITQLHLAIDREFKAAGIEIAFPQRELHIRSLPSSMAAMLGAVEKPKPLQATPDEIGSANMPDSQANDRRRSA